VYKSGTDPVADFGMYRNTRVGDFTGQVVYAGPAGLAKRDLEVSIRRERGGF